MANDKEHNVTLGDEDKVRIFDSVWSQTDDMEWATRLKIPFKDAAAKGDLHFVKKLLFAGACVGDAIVDAILGGNELVVDELLARGACVALTDGNGNTPVHLAVMGGNEHMLKSLLKCGAFVDEENSKGRRPIHLAARRGNVGVTNALLAAGANVNHRCSGLESPLDLAVTSRRSKRNAGVVKALLENGANFRGYDRVGRTALLRAARSNFGGAIDALVEAGADINGTNVSGETPLYIAARAGHPEAVVACLRHGALVIYRKALYHPANFGEHSALEVAAKFGHVDALKALVSRVGVNFANSRGITALHIAAAHNKEGAVNALVEAGATVDARQPDGQTPLHLASRSLSRETIVALLDGGANVNARDAIKQLPLHKALIASRADSAAEAVDILLRRGADETAVDANGRTAARRVGQLAYRPRYDTLLVNNHLPRDAMVAKLLANAPADRAWCRRGFLVLCRALRDKAPLRLNCGEAPGETVTCAVVSGCSVLARTGTGNVDLDSARADEGGGRGNGAAGHSDPLAALLARVVALEEDDVFRTIMSCL